MAFETELNEEDNVEVPVAIAEPKLRMYCVFSKEAIKLMNGSRGKLAAQAGHAYLHAYWDAEKRFPELAKRYRNSERAYKICLVVETTEELGQLYAEHYLKTGTTHVKDAGFTVFKEPTVTCVGIGPIDPSDCSDFLKSLKVL